MKTTVVIPEYCNELGCSYFRRNSKGTPNYFIHSCIYGDVGKEIKEHTHDMLDCIPDWCPMYQSKTKKEEEVVNKENQEQKKENERIRCDKYCGRFKVKALSATESEYACSLEGPLSGVGRKIEQEVINSGSTPEWCPKRKKSNDDATKKVTCDEECGFYDTTDKPTKCSKLGVPLYTMKQDAVTRIPEGCPRVKKEESRETTEDKILRHIIENERQKKEIIVDSNRCCESNCEFFKGDVMEGTPIKAFNHFCRQSGRLVEIQEHNKWDDRFAPEWCAKKEAKRPERIYNIDEIMFVMIDGKPGWRPKNENKTQIINGIEFTDWKTEEDFKGGGHRGRECNQNCEYFSSLHSCHDCRYDADNPRRIVEHGWVGDCRVPEWCPLNPGKTVKELSEDKVLKHMDKTLKELNETIVGLEKAVIEASAISKERKYFLTILEELRKEYLEKEDK